MEKKKIIVYSVAFVVLGVLGYFAFIHEAIIDNEPEPQVAITTPTAPTTPKVPTSIPGAPDSPNSSNAGTRPTNGKPTEDSTTEDEVFAYTDIELKAMSTSRDPFSLQSELKDKSTEVNNAYDKAKIEAEKNKDKPKDANGNPIRGEIDRPNQPTTPVTPVEPTTPIEPTEEPVVEPTEEPIEEPTAPDTVLENGERPAKILKKEDISATVTSFAKTYAIDESLVYAVIAYESKYNQNALNLNSDTTDKGLMQINSKTAPWIASKLGITYTKDMEYDPETNIKMGVYYLSMLSKISPDLDFILTAYNRGPSGANTFKEKNGTYESLYSKGVRALITGN
jgi:hypothetical protein